MQQKPCNAECRHACSKGRVKQRGKGTKFQSDPIVALLLK